MALNRLIVLTRTVVFVLHILSIPIHASLIAVLVRYRKTDTFNFPFFKLLLSVTMSDFIYCSFRLLLLLVWTIFGKHPVLLGTLTFAFTEYEFVSNYVGLFIVALNRVIVLVIAPVNAGMYWTPKWTRIAIILQHGIALMFVAAVFHPDFHQTFENATTFYPVPKGDIQTQFAQTVMLMFGLVVLGCILGVALIYLSITTKLIHHRITNAFSSGSFKTEVKFALYGLFLSCSGIVFLGNFVFYIVCGGYCSLLHDLIDEMFFEITFYTSSTIAFVMCKKLREHFWKLLQRETQVQPIN